MNIKEIKEKFRENIIMACELSSGIKKNQMILEEIKLVLVKEIVKNILQKFEKNDKEIFEFLSLSKNYSSLLENLLFQSMVFEGNDLIVSSHSEFKILLEEMKKISLDKFFLEKTIKKLNKVLNSLRGIMNYYGDHNSLYRTIIIDPI